jgi:hypothetical protein
LLVLTLLQAAGMQAARKPVLWRDPGAVQRLDFVFGPGSRGGRPVPPFAFQEEIKAGTQPKVKVRDARSRAWAVKWGREVKPEFLAGRIAWACGYFTPTNYVIRRGVVSGAGPEALGRARPFVGPDGKFADALFELWDDGYVPGPGWRWDDNPFVGTRELHGLKIIVMLTSNWDNKYSRNAREGSNTAITERSLEGRSVLAYLVSDWGSSFGQWGLPFFHRDTWNCAVYTEQTARFVERVDGERVQWGFRGSQNVGEGVSAEDVRWLMRYLGRITDRQIGQALGACGATVEGSRCIKSALRARISRLEELVR